MRRTIAGLTITLTACASGPHVYADEQGPAGIPKSVRAHCRSWAEDLAKEAGSEGAADDVRRCLDSLLRADCAEELARVAEQLERQGKGESVFFFRFPGAWEPDEVHEQVMEINNAACLKSGRSMMLALHLFHGLRNSKGGRIPWATYGAPTPSTGMCREGCPAK